MKIIVPATSANIGPGFDCLGIAWDLYNRLEFSAADKFSVFGCEKKYCNEDNIAVAGYKSACRFAGVIPAPVSVCFGECDVPVSRGLGSSAALSVAGAFAADKLLNLNLGRKGILRAAAAVEGHPDNAAPAVYGGFCAAVSDESGIKVAQFDISERWSFTALVPDTELPTSLARSALPQSYSRSDAVFNIGRIPLLIKAIETGDSDMLRTALDDRIHEPYRKPLIPGCDRAEEIARNLGAEGICISGAGSTLLCISSDSGIYRDLSCRISEEFPGWKTLSLRIDVEGAREITE